MRAEEIATGRSDRRSSESGESGQAAVSLLLMLGLFVLATLGFAIDFTNMWFHRQNARAAADAACQAGAMDILGSAAGIILSSKGFTSGVAGNCSTSSNATMCFYAAANGYNGSGLVPAAASNSVAWIFPATVSGVTTPSSTTVPYPFLTISIVENVKTHFLALVKGMIYQQINVNCTCGVVGVKAAAPMVILHPTMSGAFTYSGGGSLSIIGGPQRGLQINSNSATAALWTASGIINQSVGGPVQTGSDAGIVGAQSVAPTNGTSSGFNGGTTGMWKSNVLPIPDPFASVAGPATIKSIVPTTTTNGTWVAYNKDGCPDHSGSTGNPAQACKEFGPGYYPSGINLTSVMNNYSTAIFQPGIYYLNGPLAASGSNTLRMAKPAGFQQTDGVMFYFLSGSLNLSGCTGCTNSGVSDVNATDLTCDGSSPLAALGMPTTLTGNVLVAQCTKDGTYWDTGGDTNDSRGTTGARGILLFGDHLNTVSPQMSGSGSLIFSGSLYFHSSTYSDVLSLSGGASTGTYVLGEIIVDQVNLSGSGVIKLALNPQATTYMLKAAILQ